MGKRDVAIYGAVRVPEKDLAELTFIIPAQVESALGILFTYQEQTRKKPKPVYNLIVKPPTANRSVGYRSQNHRINGHIQQICEATGNDFDDVKEYCKSRAVSMGYPYKSDDNGVPKISLMTGQPMGISEGEATMDDARILCEAINLVAAELSVILIEHEDWAGL